MPFLLTAAVILVPPHTWGHDCSAFMRLSEPEKVFLKVGKIQKDLCLSPWWAGTDKWERLLSLRDTSNLILQGVGLNHGQEECETGHRDCLCLKGGGLIPTPKGFGGKFGQEGHEDRSGYRSKLAPFEKTKKKQRRSKDHAKTSMSDVLLDNGVCSCTFLSNVL